MIMTKAAIFDLDGTLWDATQVALPAFREVFAALCLPIPTDSVLSETLGYPLHEIWPMILPKDRLNLMPQANEMMAEKELRILHETNPRPFPGVEDTLKYIRALGYKTYICSNCDADYLKFVPDHLGLSALFDARYCAGQFHNLTKTEIVAIIKTRHGITEGYMIGDRFHDMQAGKANSLFSIGCTFGTGRPEELQGANYVITSFPALVDIFALDGQVPTDK